MANGLSVTLDDNTVASGQKVSGSITYTFEGGAPWNLSVSCDAGFTAVADQSNYPAGNGAVGSVSVTVTRTTSTSTDCQITFSGPGMAPDSETVTVT